MRMIISILTDSHNTYTDNMELELADYGNNQVSLKILDNSSEERDIIVDKEELKKIVEML